MRKIIRNAIIVLVLLFAISPILADDTGTHEDIDIYGENITDFLDFDFDEYQKKARVSYNGGEWEDAAKYYLLLAQHDVNDSNSLYNLACCYGLLGAERLAAECLEAAFKTGFTDLGHIQRDPDFDKVRGVAVFDETVEGLESILKEKEQGLGELTYVSAPAYLKSRVRLPENFNPDEEHTLLVGLHGLGHFPDGFIKLWDRFENPDFIFVSPQGPYPFSSGKEIGYAWGIWSQGDVVRDNSFVMSENYTLNVVAELKKKYKINKVYLLGFSQGCAFTYMTGIKYHDVFDGIICFGGWLDVDWITEEKLKEANSLRVFIGHGNEDRMVEFEAGTGARDKLTEFGFNVIFYEFDGAHTVEKEALQAAEKWMKE